LEGNEKSIKRAHTRADTGEQITLLQIRQGKREKRKEVCYRTRRKGMEKTTRGKGRGTTTTARNQEKEGKGFHEGRLRSKKSERSGK
jgi:hypothetical protein